MQRWKETLCPYTAETRLVVLLTLASIRVGRLGISSRLKSNDGDMCGLSCLDLICRWNFLRTLVLVRAPKTGRDEGSDGKYLQDPGRDRLWTSPLVAPRAALHFSALFNAYQTVPGSVRCWRGLEPHSPSQHRAHLPDLAYRDSACVRSFPRENTSGQRSSSL